MKIKTTNFVYLLVNMISMIKHANILDSASKREHLHFAKKYKNLLFTIQEDAVLTIWEIKDPFELIKKISVSLEGRFYRPYFQFENNYLLLNSRRGNRTAIINFQDLDNPTAVTQTTKMGYRTGVCMAKGQLYTQISPTHSIDYAFEVSGIPSSENAYPEIKNFISTEDTYNSASYSIVVDDSIYWINQDSVYVMDISDPLSPKSLANKKLVDLVTGYPLLLPGNRMLVFEIYDDQRIGLNHFDISNRDVKRKSKGLLKNHCIRGWELDGNTLYIVHLDFKKINNERKYKTYLSGIDVSSDPIIKFTKELPIAEIYGDDSSTIRWFCISNNKYMILLGNGNIYEIPF